MCDLSRNRCDAIDIVPDAATDATTGPAGRCDPEASFEMPTLVPGINTDKDELSFAMTNDELTAFLSRTAAGGTGYSLQIATRASSLDEFLVPSEVPALASVNAAANGDEYRPYPMPSGAAIYFERKSSPRHVVTA